MHKKFSPLGVAIIVGVMPLLGVLLFTNIQKPLQSQVPSRTNKNLGFQSEIVSASAYSPTYKTSFTGVISRLFDMDSELASKQTSETILEDGSRCLMWEYLAGELNACELDGKLRGVSYIHQGNGKIIDKNTSDAVARLFIAALSEDDLTPSDVDRINEEIWANLHRTDVRESWVAIDIHFVRIRKIGKWSYNISAIAGQEP